MNQAMILFNSNESVNLQAFEHEIHFLEVPVQVNLTHLFTDTSF